MFADEPNTFFHALGASGLYGLTAESFSMMPKRDEWLPPVWIVPLRGATLWGSKAPAPARLLLTLDGFLSQTVIIYHGTRVSRLAVLKHVAYIAGGVHSDRPTEAIDQTLQRIRQIGAFRPQKGGVAGAELVVSVGAIYPDAPKLEDVDRLGVDFVFLQLMSAAKYVVDSPDVIELEQIIRAEFSQRM